MTIDFTEVALADYRRAHEAEHPRAWINTWVGKKVYPLALVPEDFDVEDVAHHLSLEPRYSGANRRAYSVAQHSVYVSDYLWRTTGNPSYRKWGLCHDMTEGRGLRDLPGPIKPLVGSVLDVAEVRGMRACAYRFGLEWPYPDAVHRVDSLIVHDEALLFMERRHPDWKVSPQGIVPEGATIWPAERAEETFLMRCRGAGIR